MKNMTIVGLLAAGQPLEHEAQQGLHYARTTMVLGAEQGAVMPRTGRGRAYPGGAAGGHVAGRVALMWGKDATLAEVLQSVPRRCVVVVPTDTADACVEALRKLEGMGYEVHLAPKGLLADGPARVLASDVGRAQLQRFIAGQWQQVDTALPASQPAKKRKKASKPTQPPQEADDGGQPADS